MPIKYQTVVLGVRCFKGEVDGTNHDFTKLAVQMPLSELRGTAKGFNTVEMAVGPASEYDKYSHLPFPVNAELDIELTTKGYEVRGFKSLSQVKQGGAG